MFLTNKYISEENLEEWSKGEGIDLKRQHVKRGDVFLSSRERCKYFYYISSGFIRLYYYDLEGHEITHWFSSENMMVTSPFSFFKDELNILSFQALEDTTLILISREQLDSLRNSNHVINLAFQSLFVEFAMRLSRRVMSIHTETAETRYLNLLEEHPLIFQHAKLAHIASFLGITQQSLSRIRKNLAS